MTPAALAAVGGIRFAAFVVLIVATLLLAWRSGDAIVRTTATAWFGSWAATVIASAHPIYGFRRSEPMLAAIDLAALGILAVLTVRGRRGWLVGATAFQIIAVATHLVKLGEPGIPRWVYQIVNYGAGWGTTFAITWGAVTTVKRQRNAVSTSRLSSPLLQRLKRRRLPTR